MDLSAYQGLIFDMDGTLIDSMPAHVQAWKKTCELYEIPFDEKWFYSLGGMPTIKTAQAINHRYHQNLDTKRLANTKSEFFETLDFKGGVIPSTYQILVDNKPSKKIAVGTGCRQMNALPLLDEARILPLLDALVTADDVDNHKPNPDTFLQAAMRIGLEPQHCLVFEDTELGKTAALAAGMDCVLVVDGEITTLTKANNH
ncbi:beta-phosphoglucomutase family hydrolase [Photobacterium chitinilyticum]|uniref:Beta-phosphoglucomutase family hydrolase n=1 Tax=Photobacterium chitinilyticum TaxID=2485123 RepID=A0A444JVL4_9GAMM|nr:beta-phosphoglucomutase family hydrolase [Photobacterium chitinilyticum]RWX57119.1 beta-phosphoglucomutase family hydrolase [Photobacterium chitinilyticum]